MSSPDYSPLAPDEIIQMFSGKIVHCVAWDLIGQFSPLLDTTHLAKCGSEGRVLWEAANLRANDQIMLSRLVVLENDKVQQRNTYVGADYPMVLVPIRKETQP